MAITYTRVTWANGSGGGTPLSAANLNISEAGIEALYNLTNAKGDIIVATAADTLERLAVGGTNGHLLTVDSTAGTGLKYALSPETDLVTTKGDLLVATAADTLSRLAAGTNGYSLVADSGVTEGVKYFAPPVFRAYVSSAQAVGNNAWTKVVLNAESFDSNGWFDSTTNRRYTPLVAGYYQVNGQIGWTPDAGSAVNEPHGVGIYKNGALHSLCWGTFSGASVEQGVGVADILSMNGSTDYIELYCYQNSDTAVSLNIAGVYDCFLSGVWVRPL